MAAVPAPSAPAFTLEAAAWWVKRGFAADAQVLSSTLLELAVVPASYRASLIGDLWLRYRRTSTHCLSLRLEPPTSAPLDASTAVGSVLSPLHAAAYRLLEPAFDTFLGTAFGCAPRATTLRFISGMPDQDLCILRPGGHEDRFPIIACTTHPMHQPAHRLRLLVELVVLPLDVVMPPPPLPL